MQEKYPGIVAIENQIATQDYASAVHGIIVILSELENQLGFDEEINVCRNVIPLEIIYTRIANCIASILLQFDFAFSDSLFEEWILHSRTIAGIFAISGFQDAGFVINHLQAILQQACQTPGELSEKARQCIKRLMLAYSLFTPQDINFVPYIKLCPDYAIPTLISLLNYPVLLQERGYLRRESLFDTMALLKNVKRKQLSLSAMCATWMLCSYAYRRDKHRVKQVLNEMITNWMHINEITIKPITPQQRSKYVMVVPLEVMRVNHSMYRTFANVILPLKENFHLIAICAEGAVDTLTADMFDEVRCFDEELAMDRYQAKHIQSIIDMVQAIAPDVIYYPSIGMHTIPIVLANCRLAPVQLYSLGHPATTYSPEIDYVIMPKEVYCEQAKDLFSETILLVPMQTFKMLSVMEIDNRPFQKTAIKNVIHVIVAERSYKLNSVFLQACKAIQNGTDRQVIFHFLTNEVNIRYDQAKKDILQLLPTARVYPTLTSEAYMDLLADGDIFLATFPFASTNGAHDAAYCGLPIVTMEGEEPSSRYDAYFMRSLQAPAWLAASNYEEYIEAAIRLIEKDKLRLTISETVYANYRELIRNDAFHPEYFARLIELVCEYHIQLQVRNQKCYTLEQLIRFSK